nr:DEAD/DEAH box helicase family protein [Clostridium chromiireducens]
MNQKEILEKLKVERELFKKYKNLIVAATGVGKTVISAFD